MIDKRPGKKKKKGQPLRRKADGRLDKIAGGQIGKQTDRRQAKKEADRHTNRQSYN